ncbi:MAG: nuclear transport factor 2 family protein [Rhodanobacteraceae bacterium]
MTGIKHCVLTAAAALVFAACAGTASANHANAAGTAAKSTPAASRKDALVTLEKSAYEAWKSRDAKFWNSFLWNGFVGYGSSGKLDKASATKEYTGADCDIESYAMSDEQVRPLGNRVALLTHKTTVDGTCGGQKVPVDSWVASLYVRAGDTWKAAFHAEAPIVDPKAAPAEPADKMVALKKVETKPAASGAGTDAMLAVEKAVWEAWKEHDAKKIGNLTAKDISFINIFGTYFANKADALKDWTGAGCSVKSVSITDAAGQMLSSTVGILTFDGAADGTCFGQKIGPIWGNSVYVKQGRAWKWAFGINLPARR